jgi:hypothetical protein
MFHTGICTRSRRVPIFNVILLVQYLGRGRINAKITGSQPETLIAGKDYRAFVTANVSVSYSLLLEGNITRTLAGGGTARVRDGY